jgi:hypothetical protein
LEATKAANKAAEDALKAVTLLNGGAAVAMLAFIGHLASTRGDQATLTLLNRPLFDFVVGTFLSVCLCFCLLRSGKLDTGVEV